MSYAGGDLNLSTIPESWCDASDLSDAIVLQQCAKNIIYTFVNSNAMAGEIDHYNTATWVILLYVADALVAVGIAVWGFFAVRKALKSEEQAQK